MSSERPIKNGSSKEYPPRDEYIKRLEDVKANYPNIELINERRAELKRKRREAVTTGTTEGLTIEEIKKDVLNGLDHELKLLTGWSKELSESNKNEVLRTKSIEEFQRIIIDSDNEEEVNNAFEQLLETPSEIQDVVLSEIAQNSKNERVSMKALDIAIERFNLSPHRVMKIGASSYAHISTLSKHEAVALKAMEFLKDKTIDDSVLEYIKANSKWNSTKNMSQDILDERGQNKDKFRYNSGVDPVKEAEVYMEYGRVDQAKDVLVKALKEEPHNQDFQNRLREIKEFEFVNPSKDGTIELEMSPASEEKSETDTESQASDTEINPENPHLDRESLLELAKDFESEGKFYNTDEINSFMKTCTEAGLSEEEAEKLMNEAVDSSYEKKMRKLNDTDEPILHIGNDHESTESSPVPDEESISDPQETANRRVSEGNLSTTEQVDSFIKEFDLGEAEAIKMINNAQRLEDLHVNNGAFIEEDAESRLGKIGRFGKAAGLFTGKLALESALKISGLKVGVSAFQWYKTRKENLVGVDKENMMEFFTNEGLEEKLIGAIKRKYKVESMDDLTEDQKGKFNEILESRIERKDSAIQRSHERTEALSEEIKKKKVELIQESINTSLITAGVLTGGATAYGATIARLVNNIGFDAFKQGGLFRDYGWKEKGFLSKTSEVARYASLAYLTANGLELAESGEIDSYRNLPGRLLDPIQPGTSIESSAGEDVEGGLSKKDELSLSETHKADNDAALSSSTEESSGIVFEEFEPYAYEVKKGQGALAAFLDMKKELLKIPEDQRSAIITKIIETPRPDLAKQYGFWNPAADASDVGGKESARLMYDEKKGGDKFIFDKDGNLKFERISGDSIMLENDGDVTTIDSDFTKSKGVMFDYKGTRESPGLATGDNKTVINNFEVGVVDNPELKAELKRDDIELANSDTPEYKNMTPRELMMEQKTEELFDEVREILKDKDSYTKEQLEAEFRERNFSIPMLETEGVPDEKLKEYLALIRELTPNEGAALNEASSVNRSEVIRTVDTSNVAENPRRVQDVLREVRNATEKYTGVGGLKAFRESGLMPGLDFSEFKKVDYHRGGFFGHHDNHVLRMHTQSGETVRLIISEDGKRMFFDGKSLLGGNYPNTTLNEWNPLKTSDSKELYKGLPMTEEYINKMTDFINSQITIKDSFETYKDFKNINIDPSVIEMNEGSFMGLSESDKNFVAKELFSSISNYPEFSNLNWGRPLSAIIQSNLSVGELIEMTDEKNMGTLQLTNFVMDNNITQGNEVLPLRLISSYFEKLLSEGSIEKETKISDLF